MSYRLSACMIVKDERAFLEDCLISLEPVVDEVIVVDTGSTDGTQDLVRAFEKAKLVEIPWEDDFSKARNVSLDHATGDWILIIDADERLHPDDRDRLRKIIATGEVQAYYVDIVNFPDRQDQTVISKRLGLFQRRSDIRFENPIHEQVDVSIARARLRAAYSGIRLLHYGYDPEVRRAKKKSERNQRIIENALASDPENPFMNFNMAQEHFALGELSESVEYYQKAIKPWERSMERRFELPPYVSIAVYRMTVALAAAGEYTKAFEALRRYQLVFPDYTELRFMEAGLHARLGDYERALGIYHQCIAFGDSPTLYHNVYPGLGTYRAWYEVARIYELLGQAKHAFAALNESIKIKKDYRGSILALAHLALKHDPPEEVYRYVRRVASIEQVLKDGSLWEVFFNERAFEVAERILNDAAKFTLTPEQEQELAKRRGMTMVALERWAEAEEAFSRSHPQGLMPVDAFLAKLFTEDYATLDSWVLNGRIDSPLYGARVISNLLALSLNPDVQTPLVSENEIDFLWEMVLRIVFYRQPKALETALRLLENYGLESAEISLRLGKILWNHENKELAVEELVRAANAGKFDRESLDILARVCREKGYIEDEVTFLREAHTLTDGDPMISARLARALGELGRTIEALQILESAQAKHPYAAVLKSIAALLRSTGEKSVTG